MSVHVDELDWLLKHPQFVERPATLEEFLGDKYLNLRGTTRDEVRKVLSEIFGEEVQPDNPSTYLRALLTGGIGIGKTTVAAISLTYLVHWTLCLKDPQNFFGLMPGSRIAFVMMSTSARQAKDVIFGDVKERIRLSPWFKRYPYDPTFKSRFEFPKGVVIIPLGSEETAAEGMNVLGGVIDEIDSGKVTDRKIYMKTAYETIQNRISSRYGNRGLIFMIGQRKSQSGYAQSLLEEFQERKDAYAHIMTIWESRGEAYYDDRKNYGEDEQDLVGKWFYYDAARKEFIPNGVIEEGLLDHERMATVHRVPAMYRADFEMNPEKALRDLAGIPPAVGDPFFSYTHRISHCVDRWVEEFGEKSPVTEDGAFIEEFRAMDSIPRRVHVDIGFSGDGDALGLAMGHVRRMVEVQGELKPYIVFDVLMQVTVPSGHEISLHDMRYIIYELKEQLGFRIDGVTFDGFQSQDTIQQLNRRRIHADYLSVDKQKLPYYDLKDAIYEDRCAFPPYLARSVYDDTKLVQIAVQELSELTDNGKKIDHPLPGSKDVSDAMAGVTSVLMGDRRYHRKVVSLDSFRSEKRRMTGTDGGIHPAYRGSSIETGLKAPTGITQIGPPRGVFNPWQR